MSGTVLGAIALGAAVLALAVAGAMYLKLRRIRSAQLILLGGSKNDLVDFAVSLQGRIDDLHHAVDEVATGLSRVDRRVDGCVSKTSIVRYDAYEGAGGHQSASLAFLDSARSGVVISRSRAATTRASTSRSRPRPRACRALAGGARSRRARYGLLTRRAWRNVARRRGAMVVPRQGRRERPCS